MLRSDVRTRVEIDGHHYLLARDVDVVALMELIEAAARSVPTFVVLFGDEASVSVLVSPWTRVAIAVDSECGTRTFDDAPVEPLSDWDL